MGSRIVHTLAGAALAASAVFSPALAGSPYHTDIRPSRRVGPPPSKRGPSGLFSYSFREVRTKLEHKNCGTIRY